MDVKDNVLYLGGCNAQALVEAFGSPLYVYEEAVLREQCRVLRQSFQTLQPDFHYAVKANNNPHILRIFKDEGMGLDAVSSYEARLGLELGFLPKHIVFTGNNCTEEDFCYCLKKGILVNVGSLGELDTFGRLNRDGEVCLRLNPDVGAGHHRHVITGGPDAKFGISHDQVHIVRKLLKTHNLRLIGVHCHIGTGILRVEDMMEAMEVMLQAAQGFDFLEFIDFGGGFGVPYHPDEKPLPLNALAEMMEARFEDFCKDYGRSLRMVFEPGRLLTAQAGVLLGRVTNISHTSAHVFVGMDTGFNHLIRPAFYGSHHEIVNASQVQGDPQEVVVVGNICESGDVFTQNKQGIEHRWITKPKIGQVLALLDAGAYGMSLSMQYNMRPRPAEVLVQAGESKLIRRREVYEDLMRQFV